MGAPERWGRPSRAVLFAALVLVQLRETTGQGDCTNLTAPENGGLGNCNANGQLANGSSCSPTCGSNYIMQPSSASCTNGTLVVPLCYPKLTDSVSCGSNGYLIGYTEQGESFAATPGSVNFTNGTLQIPMSTTDPGNPLAYTVAFVTQNNQIIADADHFLFPAGSIGADTTVKVMVIRNDTGQLLANTEACEFNVRILDNQPPVMNCPPDLANVVTDSGKATATIGGGGFPFSIASLNHVPTTQVPRDSITLNAFSPPVVVATDNVNMVGFTIQRVVPAANESCAPAFLGLSQAVNDACAAVNISSPNISSSQQQCEAAAGGNFCMYTAASSESLINVQAGTQFPIGLSTVIYRAEDNAQDDQAGAKPTMSYVIRLSRSMVSE